MADNKTFNNQDMQNLFKVINALDPTNPQDYVTLSFLQGYVAGQKDTKDAVKALAPGNIAGTFSAGANTITAASNGAFPSQDGVTLGLNDRILLPNQTAGLQNGIFVLTQVGDGGSPYILTRSSDANTSAEVTQGLYTIVSEGTVYGKSGWLLNTPDPITLNTTSLTFVQNTALADVVAGDALSKVGNTLNVNVDGVTVDIQSDQLKIHNGYTGQTSITTLGTITTGVWNGTTIAVANGGTGATDAATARGNLGAAKSGSNSDITELTGLTTALSIGQGGTGSTTAAGARTNIGATGLHTSTLTAGQAVYNVSHTLGTTAITDPLIKDITTGTKLHGVAVTVVNSTTVQVDFGTTLTANANITFSGL